MSGASPEGRPRDAEVLETERLVLEPVTEDHARHLIQGLADPFLYRFSPGSRPLHLRGLRKSFRAVRMGGGRQAPGAPRVWAAFGRAERRYVGLFELTLREEGGAELGYVIFSRFMRRGHGREACLRILQHVFVVHSLRAVVLETGLENIAARRLAERLGFQRTSPEQRAAREALAQGRFHYTLEAGAFFKRERAALSPAASPPNRGDSRHAFE